MSRCLVALVAVMALCACTPADTETTSTTASTTTSSTVSTTTTTTTTAPTTTTTTLLEGMWAEVPLVVVDRYGGMALGWWDGAEWVQVEWVEVGAGTSLPVSGGEDYQVVLLGGGGVLQGGPPHNEGCDVAFPMVMPGVPLSDGNALYTTISGGQDGERQVSGVAISAPWELTPRPVADGEAHPDLEQQAIEILAARNFVTDSVQIVQTIDVDLEGNGAIETLVVVEETEIAEETSGVYSLVFALSPAWQDSRVVEASVIPPDDTGFPATFRISAVSDLSGDGLMEVVLDGGAWENQFVWVYELTDEGFVKRIGAGCGV